MARDGRPWGEGGVADGAGPAALPGLVVMGVRDGVLPSGRSGDDWRGGFCRNWMNPITYTCGRERTRRCLKHWQRCVCRCMHVCVCVCVCSPRSPSVHWNVTPPERADSAAA